MMRYLVIVLLLAVSGCVCPGGFDAEDSSTETLRDLSMFNEAVESKNTTYCSLIVDEYLHTICYLGFAWSNSSISSCEGIRNQTFKQVCVASIAVSTKNASACEGLDYFDARMYCLAGVADDPSYCFEVEDETIRSECLKVASEDSTCCL